MCQLNNYSKFAIKNKIIYISEDFYIMCNKEDKEFIKRYYTEKELKLNKIYCELNEISKKNFFFLNIVFISYSLAAKYNSYIFLILSILFYLTLLYLKKDYYQGDDDNKKYFRR